MARTEKRARGEDRVPSPYNAPGNDGAASAVPSPPGSLDGDTAGVDEDMDNDAAEVDHDDLNDEKQGASPENECEGNLDKDADNESKQDDAAADKNKKKQETKQPHDDDPTAAASDSKVDAVVVGSHKKKKRRYTKNQKVELIALICQALCKSDGTKEAKNQIIRNYDVDPSSYYRWVKACIVCQDKIKKLSTDCVVCSTKTCQVRLCYDCFGKHFIHKLSISTAFLQVYAVDCGWCQAKDSVVVREFEEHQPTRTFNKDIFHEVLLVAINEGVKECEQLLGKLTGALAGFRHDLIEVVDSVTEKPFDPVEYATISSFAEFIQKYHGLDVADCDFVAKMKDVVQVSRWLTFNKIHLMNTQIGNLKKIHAQFLGVRA